MNLFFKLVSFVNLCFFRACQCIGIDGVSFSEFNFAPCFWSKFIIVVGSGGGFQVCCWSFNVCCFLGVVVRFDFYLHFSVSLGRVGLGVVVVCVCGITHLCNHGDLRHEIVVLVCSTVAASIKSPL